MSQFDADALERAAKAARELESSKNVKALLELSKREAEVKKSVEERKAAEANAQRAAYQKEQEVVRWEEQRKTLQYQKETQRVRMGAKGWGCACLFPSVATFFARASIFDLVRLLQGILRRVSLIQLQLKFI